MGPVVKACLQGLLNQQGSESGAVDKQIAFDHTSVIQQQMVDKACRRYQRHFGDFAFNTRYTAGLCHGAQVTTICRGVEMIGVIQLVLRHNAESIRLSGFQLCAIFAVFAGQPFLFAAHPEMLKATSPAPSAGIAEGVNVVVALMKPILEPNAELESAVSELDKVGLGDL